MNLPATMLLIDDDPFLLRRYAKESLRQTNLGVLTAENLRTAANFLDQDFRIGAVLADLNFVQGTEDAERNLYSGLDFLKYLEERKPDTPVYVLSVDAVDRDVRSQAEEMGLNVRAWYDKLRSMSNASQFSPWVQIERDLIIQALKSKPAFRDEATSAGENPTDLVTDEAVADKVRTIFNYPRLTYLQDLPERCGYRLKKPIEVHCWPAEGGFRVEPINIPLLALSEAEDIVEAIDLLRESIIAEMKSLDSEEEEHISGYARFIKARLQSYIARESEGANAP